jgi:7,8-dihydroneopterin aldolase/epimerase/oxygenase
VLQESDNNLFTLSVNDLRVWVHLGCTDHEKFSPQMVSFNITINFTQPPLGAEIDFLQDTVCYKDIVKTVTAQSQEKNYSLIEHLVQLVHKRIVELVHSYSHVLSITVTLHKISPPAPGLHGGVKWTQHINYKPLN